MSSKAAKPANVELRRLPMDSKRLYKAQQLCTFDIGEPYIDVIMVPLQGGTLRLADVSGAKDGTFKCRFDSTITRLAAILYSVK